MHGIKDFTYIPKSNTLSADASDLTSKSSGGPTGRTLIIKSERTGREIEFTLTDFQRDNENEITAWVYTQTTPDPSIKITRVVVFND